MAWMETDYSKHMHFRWKIKWWLEHLGALGVMGEMAPLSKGEGAVGIYTKNTEMCAMSFHKNTYLKGCLVECCITTVIQFFRCVPL